MNKFKVLIKGYAHPGESDTYVASPTTTLIESKGKRVLVDPGANSNLLLQSFRKEKLKVNDINIVYLTHYHLDHILNIRLFPDHNIYDGETLWKKDEEFFHSGKIPGTDIKILPTPGHSPEHTSLLVKTKDKGVVCIAADVFWWEDGKQESNSVEKLLKQEDPYANDFKTLLRSRKKLLEVADYIIPGHGKIFINPSKSLT